MAYRRLVPLLLLLTPPAWGRHHQGSMSAESRLPGWLGERFVKTLGFLTFFSDDSARLADDCALGWCACRHRPWLDHLRKNHERDPPPTELPDDVFGVCRRPKKSLVAEATPLND